MTDAKFKELANLYLDEEITDRELAQLKDVLASDERRRHEFLELCRLQKAMQHAFGSTLDANAPRSEPPKEVRFRRWVAALAAAASFAVGGVVALAFLPEGNSESTTFAEKENAVSLPVDVSSSDFRRYEAFQRNHAPDGLSLAAQLRLSGLSPDLVPTKRAMHPVDTSAKYVREDRNRHTAELFERFEQSAPMPPVRLIDEDGLRAKQTDPRWPGNFQSSLVHYQ